MRTSLAGLLALWLASWQPGCGGAPAAPPVAPTPAPAPAAPASKPAATPAAPAPAAAPPVDAAWSEATFDAQLQAAIHRRFPAATLTPLDADSYRIAMPPPAQTLEVNFAKAHRSCYEDWTSCQSSVDYTLQAVAEAIQPRPVTAAQLRVVLRSTAKIAVYQTKGALTVRPFAGDAQWVLVADMPTTIQFQIKPSELGMTDDQAWRTAIHNMQKPTASLISAVAVNAIIYQDDYAPSALLDPAALEQAAHQKFPGRTGALIAVCPEENFLIYTIGGSEEVTMLRTIVGQAASRMRLPLSTQVMQWTNGAWQPAP